MSKIDELLEEVQRLRASTQPADEAGLVKAANAERDQAIRERNRAVEERDAAVAELAEVKKAVQWTMGKLQIRDIIFMRSDELPSAADGWLNGFGHDPEDTRRIAWINTHARMRINDASILFALPHCIDPHVETFPDVYNFRHFVDIARRTHRPSALPLP